MGFQSLPYVVALFSALLWTYYALIKQGNTFLLITINAFGSLVESVYVIIFIVYATPHAKKQTLKVLSCMMGLLLAICLGSFVFLEGQSRAFVVGWVCVGVSVCVFAAPLTIVYQVVKTKSVEFMPFPLSCFLTLSAMMWFGYGMFAKDLCVTVPNVLGFVLGVIQMGLYQYYKHKSKGLSIPEIKLPEHTKTCSSEVVHPVESGRRSGASQAQIKEEEQTKAEDDGVCVVQLVDIKHVLAMCAA